MLQNPLGPRCSFNLHLRRIFGFSSRTLSSSGESSPSDDGDSGPDGNPDRSYGFRRGSVGSPRVSAFPRRDGGGRANGGGGHPGGGCSGGRNIDWPRFSTSQGRPDPDRSGLVFPKKDTAKPCTDPWHQKNFPPLAAGRKETTRRDCWTGQRSSALAISCPGCSCSCQTAAR